MKGPTLEELVRMKPFLVERVRARSRWLEGPLRWRVGPFRPILSIVSRIPLLRGRLLEFDFHTRERIVEQAWLHRWLPEPGSASVLDLGSAESHLPFELASLGHRVTALDVRSYALRHPELSFVLGDICRMPFVAESFDFVSCISTLEHVGVPSYRIPGFADGDRRGLDEIRRVLRPAGRLMLSVPFGPIDGPATGNWQRIYDGEQLDRLLSGWRRIEERFYLRRESRWWRPAEKAQVERAASDVRTGANGVAILLLERS